MSARVVNLRGARKARARDEARRKGHENAAKHGLTRAERDADAARAERERRDLDGKKREE